MKTSFSNHLRSIALRASIVGATFALVACATGQPPVAQMATAREAIRQAEGSGAPELAPTELLAARDKMVRAEAASRDKRYEEATRLTDEAAADADLAERKARAIKARTAQVDLQRSNGVLVDELSRKPQ